MATLRVYRTGQFMTEENTQPKPLLVITINDNDPKGSVAVSSPSLNTEAAKNLFERIKQIPAIPEHPEAHKIGTIITYNQDKLGWLRGMPNRSNMLYTFELYS